MPAVWFALKRSLQCQSVPLDVRDPKANGNNLSNIATKKSGRSRSGCSKSIANLKDVVIHGTKRHMNKRQLCSPRSIGSHELLNPIAHEVVLSSATSELKVTGCFGALQDGNGSDSGGGNGNDTEKVSTFMGALKLGNSGPLGSQNVLAHKPKRSASAQLSRRAPKGFSGRGFSGFGGIPSKPRASFGAETHGSSATPTCHKCREQFAKWEAVEAHHLSQHAVSELVEGDSSRKIVEIICLTSWLKSENNSSGGIERILKVHNMKTTLAQFEAYREMVKIRASKLPKKHPRCLADGNELLRFCGTTAKCPLGINGSSSLCALDECNVCRILRNGFSTSKQVYGGIGVFTTSTSGRAFESIDGTEENPFLRKVLIICRVIAGRVHKPLENIQEMANQSGFDSLAGKVGVYSNIEELYLLSPRALLPCFVVICKPEMRII